MIENFDHIISHLKKVQDEIYDLNDLEIKALFKYVSQVEELIENAIAKAEGGAE